MTENIPLAEESAPERERERERAPKNKPLMHAGGRGRLRPGRGMRERGGVGGVGGIFKFRVWAIAMPVPDSS